MRHGHFTIVAKSATNANMLPKEPFAKFRKDAGLTINQAAKELGVDRTTIIRWEKGEPRIPLKRLDEAKELLKVPSKRELRPDIFEAAE